ncbi:DNA-binding response regulator [Dictyobacter alpinus]|uniref:DNA-binding response regulator n=1 Tax=Dictyobacter alpinus TaxID=2014873 RepID=A0A402B4V3_9CHLR|nr:response regulator transcription factor [Dictyobacter alpinus]GCE26362.1 DNA-binding response regulator [Dictyobacter alpinus]
MARILVVEDELDICNLICHELEGQGHQVYQAFDGRTALHIVEQQQPLHLIILDWMLPELDGLTVCRNVREKYLVPIIMLTARTDEVDRILGLEVGADDYISKPFSVRELTARVRAMLRRIDLDKQANHDNEMAATITGNTSTGTSTQTTIYAHGKQVTLESALAVPPPIIRGSLHISIAEHTVMIEQRKIDLTPKEYELLILLVKNPGRAFSREFLLQELWGYNYDGFDRTVDTHMTRLRKKLGALGEKIVTVWGVGYRFVA